MTKKACKQKCLLSVLTNNLNWESSTKNLVTFNFNIMGVDWEIWFFFRVRKLKRQGVGQLADLRSGGKEPGEKEKGDVFDGVSPPSFWKTWFMPWYY